METLVIVIHFIVALFMILVVLVQGGNQGGIGAVMGGGNTSGVFGASGATSFLGKLTYAAAAVFMVTSITLTIIEGGGKTGLTDKLEKKTNQQAPVEAAKPADPTAPAAVPVTPAPATPAQ